MKWNIRELKSRAAELVWENGSAARRLALLYCGVLAVLSLGSDGLSLYLQNQIGSTGGLDGIGLRSVLQTAQEILYYINVYFGPFWSAGFLFAMIAMVRGRSPEPHDLTEGFRRFGRIIGYLAFQLMLVFGLGVAAMYLGTAIFALTPTGKEFFQAMAPVLQNPNLIGADGLINMELFPQELMLSGGIPLTALVLTIFGAFYLFVSYRFRLALYLLMDRPIRAVHAHFLSQQLMRGHKMQMFRMDLSYWWYYGLILLIGAVGDLGVILSLLGVPVAMDPTVLYFVLMAVCCVLNLCLCLWKKCRVDASYVLAYELIANPEPQEG